MSENISALWNEADGRWMFGVDGEGSILIGVETYNYLFAGQAQGYDIGKDQNGDPILVEPPAAAPLTGNDLIKSQIAELESQQTKRREREALLGIDNGWLADLEDQIQALRVQLT